MRLKFVLLMAILAAGFLSCSYFSEKPECVNKDNFFESNTPDTEAYQNRVKDVLKNADPGDFRYFFNAFSGEDYQYMWVNMRSKDHCFDAKIFMSNWDKLQGMRQTNGKSYPEELRNVKWKLEEVEGKEEILFIEMEEIID